MNQVLRIAVAIGACAWLSVSAFADNEPKKLAPGPQWNVRVEVLMVDMPQAKALALLPDLRDSGKIDGAVAQVLTAIDHNEATLVGYPVIETVDGQRAVSETVIEQRYPTEYRPPNIPMRPGPPPPPSSPGPCKPPIPDVATPTAFEARNVGVTVELEPHVLQNGDWIRLSLVPQRTVFLNFETFVDVVGQPKFFTAKITSTITLRNGGRNLLGFHKLPLPGNPIELVIVQAWAAPIK